MAKIKIPFNNKNYSVDEQSLFTASDALKSHLQTVMNGAGATIKLGGTAYNVDSTKLTATTNAFISHLGTVSGNGYKVKIGGIEYGVDADKMAGAIAQIEAVLGGWHNPDGIESPEKNEYGFYYNVPYIGHIVEDYGNGDIEEYDTAMIFYEDGKILYLYEEKTEYENSNYFTFGDQGLEYTYNSSSNTATDENGYDYIFSSDGLSFTVNSHGDWGSIDGVNFTATENLAHSIYFYSWYMSDDGSQLIFSDDGSAMYITFDGTQTTFDNLNWDTTMYYAFYEAGDSYHEWSVSIDGENILMRGSSDDKWFTRTANPSDAYIPGLYQTGALERYNTDGAAAISNMRIASMINLIASGGISIENGVLNHTPMSKTRVAVPSCALEGDLLLPQDGSVTSIAPGAFTHCYGLTGILLPSGLTSIGEHAFSYTSMESITIPNTVTYIGPWALDTEHLQHIVFDGTMQEWEMVTKDLGWNELAPATYVQCSDGQVSLV